MHALLATLERHTLKIKLIFGFISLLLLILGIGLDSLNNQHDLNANIQSIWDKGVQGLSRAKDAQWHYTLIGRTLRQAIIAPDAEGREQALKQLSQARTQLPVDLEEVRLRWLHQGDAERFARLEQALAAYMREVDRALLFVNGGDTLQAQHLVSSRGFQEVGIEATNRLTDLIQLLERTTREVTFAAQKIARQGLWLTALLVGCGLLLGILCGVLVDRSIRGPLYRIRDAVVELSRGDLDHPVPHADYPNEFGELARAIAVLQAEARQMETQRWIKSHSAEISGALQMATTPNALAQRFFADVAPLIQLGYGAIYLADEPTQRLRLLDGFAHRGAHDLAEEIPFGQGLVGQCALERTPIRIHDPPEGYRKLVSALGESLPRSMAILPVLRNRRLLGVVELATLTHHGPEEQALLDHLLPTLAVSLEILDRGVRSSHLLAETRSQAARLEEQTLELAARQQRIEMTEAWYRGIIESAPDGMVVLDAEGRILLINPRIETMFGFSGAELLGQAIVTLVPHLASWDALIDTGSQTSRELHARRKDETTIPLEYATTPMFKDGQLIGTVVVLRDITERKRAENALRDQFAFQQALIDTIPYPVFYKGADSRFLGFNRAYEETFAVQRTELIGKRVLDLEYLPEADRIAYQREDERVIAEAASVQREMPIPFADGKVHDTIYFVSGFRRADGSPGGLVGTFIDVSDRKKVVDLERFTRLAQEREARIIELEATIARLSTSDAHDQPPAIP